MEYYTTTFKSKFRTFFILSRRFSSGSYESVLVVKKTDEMLKTNNTVLNCLCTAVAKNEPPTLGMNLTVIFIVAITI